MSEAHPDADLVKVTRTTTTYEPAGKQTETISAKPRNGALLWVIGICAVVAVAVGGILYYNSQTTPASIQQSAASSAQALDQQAASSQQAAQAARQSADQARAQATTLTANAVRDRRAATLAAARAAGKASPTD